MPEPNLIQESRRLCRVLESHLPQYHATSLDATFLNASGELVWAKVPSKVSAAVGHWPGGLTTSA